MKLHPLIWAIVALGLASHSRAQLAITEAMSSGSTNKGPSVVAQHSDFWELTNFGASSVDLTGYRFFDSANNLAGADPTIFQGLTIEPGESILFVQTTANVVTNVANVRDWWGLPENVKIRFYATPGFSSGGDGIRVWGPNATDPTDVVDSVDFPEAQRGLTFTYQPETGEFGAFSAIGVSGSFQAATTDDVGSPGKNTGPTPLRISQQPTNVIVNAGDTARLTVVAQGRPRGRVQWYFGTTLLEGATKATLEIPNVQFENAGRYHAMISNGLTNVDSAQVEVVLQSQATAPSFTQSPADLIIAIGQGRTFEAHATAVPQPDYQWQFNGQDIEGASLAHLQFTAVALEQTGQYSVIARNALGSTTNYFHISVTPVPNLKFTEIMSSATVTNAPRADWWEIANFGSHPVRLKGYRFDDGSQSLAAATTITNDVTIEPGEVVVFVESMTPEAFKEWWGAENLPAQLKIISYSGGGLSLSSAGDAVNLWNQASVDNFDYVASQAISVATNGVSFRYNPETQSFGELSVPGVFGAFSAAIGGDIGSPGYITAPPARPEITEFVRNGSALSISWKSVLGTTYVLQSRETLSDGAWATVKTLAATGLISTEPLSFEGSTPSRFYRVIIE